MEKKYDAPKIYKDVNNVDVFVLTCIDPRFTYFLTWFLNHNKEARNNYDLFALAGSSMCADLTTQTPPPDLPSTLPWLTTFNDHIGIATALHNIKEVWIFDHLGCGAYINYLNGDDSSERHIVNMKKMRDHIKVLNSNLKVKIFLMDLEGNITLIESESGGITKFTFSSYYPENKWIIMFWVTFSIFIGFLLSLGYFKIS